MIQFYRIITLIKKELIGVWRDPKSRLSLIAPPLLQLFIFTFAATLDVKNVTIGVWNLDRGNQSYELLTRFQGAPIFSKIIPLNREDELAPFLDQQKGLMILSIRSDFSERLLRGETPVIQFLLDGRKSNTAQIVSGYAKDIIAAYGVEFQEVNGFQTKPVKICPRNWFNPNLLYHWYNIPSFVSTLAMLTCLIVTSISVARERELGTFDQLLVSPLIPLEILIGKIVPGIIVGMIEGLLMVLAGVFIFQVPFTGSLPLFMLSLFVFITSVSGIGLFISSLSKTQQQAMLGTFVFMVPSVLLSGFATPIENMPTWLQPVTYFIPLRYMLVISKGIFLKALPAKFVLLQVWPMALIAAVNFIASGISFRRRLG